MNFKIVTTITLLFIAMTTAMALAQPGLPPGPEQAPIDGGLGILAAIGGTYAIKKLRDRNKRE